MNKIILPFILAASFLYQINGQNLKHYTQKFNAKQLFEICTSHNLMLSKKGIVLNDQILIDDDGPASGYYSDPGALEVIKKNIVLKKILVVKSLPVMKAYIAAMLYPGYPAEPNNGRHVVFNLNGHNIIYEVKHFWTRVPVPVKFLKTGDDIITLKTLEPDTQFKTYVALDKNFKYGSLTDTHSTGRSFKSTDNGKSWTQNLGIDNNASGEYSVRLKLIGYKFKGTLLSPVIDIAANSNIGGILEQPVQIKNVSLNFDKYEPGGSFIKIEYRSGFTKNISDSSWSAWRQYLRKNIPPSNLEGRYFQVKLNFKTNSRIVSSVLTGFKINCSYKTIGTVNPNAIQVLSSKNYKLINSSLPFEYENPKFNKLQAFRKKYKLDSVVAGAKTEFEKMLKLKSWVAEQWKWHLLKPSENLMAWNADKILTPDSTGDRGGFCADYSIVLMQALQSFGFPARFVIMNYSVWGGHEVVEAWSNDFGKWILLDANYDTYFANPKTGIPYNVLELHKIFLKAYYPNSSIDRNNWSRESFVKKAEKVGKNVPVICITGGGADGGTLKNYEWWKPTVKLSPYMGGLGFLSAGYIRYMPRSNFLSQPYPVPVNEGRTHWPWTGYYCWYDSKTPPDVEHKIFTSRKEDLYWNLNEIDFSSLLLSKNKIRIEMRTNSPNFSHYVININGDKTYSERNDFVVKLKKGVNEIRMRVMDIMGNEGPVSFLKLIL